MNRLIALYSPAPRSGKSTVATRLQHHGFTIVSFARPIKLMMAALLEYQGVDEETIYRAVYDDLKETPMDELGGQHNRYGQQHLGTKWGRDTMGRDFWLGIARRRIELVLRNLGGGVVIDDMRFENEFEMVKAMGGMTVRIRRPGASDSSGHASEGALDHHRFDYEIVNNGTLDQLFDSADDLGCGYAVGGYVTAPKLNATVPGAEYVVSNAADRSRYVGGHGAGEPV